MEIIQTNIRPISRWHGSICGESRITWIKIFPDAKSKQVVDFRGKRYRRTFFPLEMSRSGKTVIEWGKGWEQIDDKDAG
jgi:hypothetical protein